VDEESVTVQQGDCIFSLARQNGFFWETLWNHADNSQLKQLRKDPSILQPNDVVKIPKKEPREESRGTDAKHQFKLKGTPVKVRIKVLREGKPRANQPYRLTIDGKLKTGQTDGSGLVELTIPANAKSGELRVGKGTEEEIYEFQLGTVDPLDTEAGARGRLADLGYDESLPFDELLKEFQGKEGITPASGTLDAATQAKLKERFGQ